MSEEKEQISKIIKVSKIIKDLNKNIIYIDKKLGQLFNFMILDDKIKLNIELTKIFFNNIYNDYTLSMTTEHEIDIEGCASANTTTSTYGFLQSYNKKNKRISTILNDYNKIILTCENNLDDFYFDPKFKIDDISNLEKIIQINKLSVINYINKISNEEAEKLFSLKLYFVEKREYYENLTKLYTIPNNLSFIHIITCIVILILIFIIKITVMQIYNYIYTFTNMQCNNISIS